MSPNNKTDSEEFDEDDLPEPVAGGEDLDVDHIIKGLDSFKRRGSKLPDPAWRRLERYREDKQTDELLSDFADYDIGEYGENGQSVSGSRKKKKPKKRAL